MKKEFDCVKYMREQRNKLSKEYLAKPNKFLQKLSKSFSDINHIANRRNKILNKETP